MFGYSFFVSTGPIFSCRKAEGDPWLSFRSRDKRLVGTWIYNDTINGYPESFKIRINENGSVDWIAYTTWGKWSPENIVKTADWYWTQETTHKLRKTKFIFENINHDVEEYNLISLRNDEIKVWYLEYFSTPSKISYRTYLSQK